MESEQIAATKKPIRETNTTTPANSGAAMMREAADEELKRECKNIVRAIAESSIKGHIQSSKFLYALADKNQKTAAAPTEQLFQDLVDEFANEPEWAGVPAGERAKEAAASAEPEI